jgi:hypothetical protein
MVALGGLDPQDIIEKEAVAIRRSKPLMGEAGAADHHLAQLPAFRMHAEGNAGR